MSKKSEKVTVATIALNRRAKHKYFIEERYEAGMVLFGWEVKSLRQGRCQIDESYVIIKNGEAWLLGALITPLLSASTHVETDAARTRKLLLRQKELSRLIGAVERKGYTIVPLSLYWSKQRVKAEIALVRGKKDYDKRTDVKERDWQRQKERLLHRPA